MLLPEVSSYIVVRTSFHVIPEPSLPNSSRTRIEFTYIYGIVCVDSNSCFEAITSLLFEQGNEGYY